jgi:hypothetical protein
MLNAMNVFSGLISAIALIAATSLPSCANAAEIGSRIIADRMIKLSIVGEITNGDSLVLSSIIERAEARPDEIMTVELSSIGGSLYEGAEIARIIRAKSLNVSVAAGKTCASACFLAFAAGARKSIEQGSRIGVHAASSELGGETPASISGTASMARIAGIIGVPSSIIKVMITTPPDQMFWLTEWDLAAMGALLSKG